MYIHMIYKLSKKSVTVGGPSNDSMVHRAGSTVVKSPCMAMSPQTYTCAGVCCSPNIEWKTHTNRYIISPSAAATLSIKNFRIMQWMFREISHQCSTICVAVIWGRKENINSKPHKNNTVTLLVTCNVKKQQQEHVWRGSV